MFQLLCHLVFAVVMPGDRCDAQGHTDSSGLRVGSCCSGLSAELLALEMLRVSFVSCVACEIDHKLLNLNHAMHGHCNVFSDCCTEEFLASPSCDLFVAGFPCQPFSKAGNNHGILDPRGHVIFWILRWLWLHKPLCFILENVGNFAQQHKETLDMIISILTVMNIYHVEWKVLENSAVGWLPQHRERIFICGVRKASLLRPFVWPGDVAMLPLRNYFKENIQHQEELGMDSLNNTEKNNVQKLAANVAKQGWILGHEEYVCDISGSVPHAMWGVSPCLTVTRAGSSGHWLSWLERKMTTREILSLQGISLERVGDYWHHMSERQLRRAAGNAVPVPLLARVIKMVLIACGKVH
ncbi:unnamed protein product [Cladocopium goreaui]|uniref:tRNA (cytosine(38)-C(5))-methyltransferase n=1 Tax=Cladocopium goreaui TaxID=2562237 RepID=A0A9P1DCP8_9DINO|nr:unnamed protein product [Cladocopium goreaui]